MYRCNFVYRLLTIFLFEGVQKIVKNSIYVFIHYKL